MDEPGREDTDRLVALAARAGRASRDRRVRALADSAVAHRRAAGRPDAGPAERRRLLCEATGYARAVLRLQRGAA